MQKGVIDDYGITVVKHLLMRYLFVGEFPYQCVLALDDGFRFCGASLIDPLGTGIPKYVITAAHCVKIL